MLLGDCNLIIRDYASGKSLEIRQLRIPVTGRLPLPKNACEFISSPRSHEELCFPRTLELRAPQGLEEGGCDRQRGNSPALLALERTVGSCSSRRHTAPVLAGEPHSSVPPTPPGALTPETDVPERAGRAHGEKGLGPRGRPAPPSRLCARLQLPSCSIAGLRGSWLGGGRSIRHPRSHFLILLTVPQAFWEARQSLNRSAEAEALRPLRRRGSGPEEPPVAGGTPRTEAPAQPLILGLRKRLQPLCPSCGGGFALVRASFLWRPGEKGTQSARTTFPSPRRRRAFIPVLQLPGPRE